MSRFTVGKYGELSEQQKRDGRTEPARGYPVFDHDKQFARACFVYEDDAADWAAWMKERNKTEPL